MVVCRSLRRCSTWGNEIRARDEYDSAADVEGSFNEAYKVIRERVAAGGAGWTPN
jgi:hypothetical protein